MGTPAATIDDAIDLADNNVAFVSYGNPVGPVAPTESLLTQMNLWIAGMFLSSSIFPPNENQTHDPGQRSVTDWYAQHLIAVLEIEGPGVGAAGVVGTSAVINAVSRVLWAVKFATTNGEITAAQQTAVVNLYNTVWA